MHSIANLKKKVVDCLRNKLPALARNVLQLEGNFWVLEWRAQRGEGGGFVAGLGGGDGPRLRFVPMHQMNRFIKD